MNKEGELIGVTFAIPTDAHARFSYHLHADELRGFLAEPGEKPLLLVPDAWDIGPRVQLVDVLHEGRAQALVAGEERPEQILLDVAGATPRDALRNGNLEALVGNREFRAQVALHLTPWERAAFYDSTGRGQFDLILVAKREGDEAGLEYRRQADGTWTVRENPGRKWLDGSNLADPRLGRRLRSLLAAF